MTIGRITYKNILASRSRSSKEFDLDACEDEVRPTPDDKFQSVQLVENLARSVKIASGLSPEVRFMLIKYL